MIYVDLVLDTGALVRVEARPRDEDALYEAIDNARARGDWWAPGMFDGCSASFLGLHMAKIDMRRVVGTL